MDVGKFIKMIFTKELQKFYEVKNDMLLSTSSSTWLIQ